MWADVGTWALVLALVWVLFLFIRHGKRLSELNAEDRTMAEEREQVDARLIYEGEKVNDLEDTKWDHCTCIADGDPGVPHLDTCRSNGFDVGGPLPGRGSADYLNDKTTAQKIISAVTGDWDHPTTATATQDMTVALVAENVRPIERPRERRRLAQVEDELGPWSPWAHDSAEPLILGDVLAWRKWHTIRPAHVGMHA